MGVSLDKRKGKAIQLVVKGDNDKIDEMQCVTEKCLLMHFVTTGGHTNGFSIPKTQDSNTNPLSSSLTQMP